MDILNQMIARAKANPQRIVLPEGDEPRTLEAANILLRDKIAQLILIGDPEKIKGMAAEKGYEYIQEAKIVDPINDPKMPEYVNLLFELRKAKGMTEEEAKKKAQDPLYLGCLMIKAGDADGELAGARGTTADTIRPAFQILKTKPGCSIVSGAFLMFTLPSSWARTDSCCSQTALLTRIRTLNSWQRSPSRRPRRHVLSQVSSRE